MLSNCINPKCRRPLNSFAEGRLYHFDIVAISIPAVDENRADFDETPKRQNAQFWLCGHCSETMTVALEPLDGVRLLPVFTTTPSLPLSV